MVVKKRLDYGFQIDRIPVIPRAPRSVRRRGSRKKLVEESQICAFELLAAVAGKLLLESESSTSSNAQEGKIQVENFKNEEKNLKSECFDQGSCVESEFTRDSPPQLEDVNLDLKLDISTKLDSDSAPGGSGSANGMMKANSGSVKECVNNNNDNNNTVIINSEGSVQLQPLYREERNNEGKLGIIIDDDENSFGFKGNKVKTFRPQSRFGYRRIRKILTSKYWKSGSKLKDFEYSDHYEGMKPFYRNRKSLYTREGSSKRRKMNDHTFVVGSDQEASSESISNEPDNKGPSGIQKSRDANVKLSIKSFKVPELYVEVPETATIGALKRTVLEAVKAILGGNLRVGVIVKGKKVRDDYRTLEQAGISDINNLENLGFTLEPSFNYVSPKVSPKKPRDPVKKLPRSPVIPYVELGVPINETPVSKTEKTVEVNHELTILPPKTPNEGAFIGPPIMNVEALAVVPVGLGLGLGSGSGLSPNPKPRRTELSQRRTRRPFSVGEVEALVEAVEKLGTGRWRDVKMRAFDNADHRTYVDLKDKWKTLVHTASISPQQRRGEPVPQELLDRVLAAHGYWSQNQSKQQVKQQHHVEALRITDGLMEGVIA